MLIEVHEHLEYPSTAILIMIYLRTYIVLALTILVVLVSTYALFPKSREQLYEEDRLIENITVVILMTVAVCAAAGMFYVRGKPNRLTMVLCLVLGLFATLEETSYGERIFGFTAPQILDYKIDAVHDVFFLVFKVIKDLAEAYGGFVYVVFSVFVGLSAWSLFEKREVVFKIGSSLLHRPPFFYIGLFIALGLTALRVDLRILKFKFLQAFEEGLEMIAAVALAFGCFTAFKA